ncbi:putative peroxidase-related enzyme [Reticulomyxa filosa]|uniref:Putative peroxidase-related enzyme n=1 Tax=Reticulomyxa filosa TaxID=46433 RepID=X6MQC7_RETFI|nr:putative peroxidase-related enzyme [Reticulomyxa filosa]|eukprot:ETO16049.1 putative peroxidase-related enzyme [Reticulomyxa filosa]
MMRRLLLNTRNGPNHIERNVRFFSAPICNSFFEDLMVKGTSDPRFSKLPTDIQEKLLEVQNKSQFIPNIFLGLTHRPNEFRAFFNYYDALMNETTSELTLYEKEMIVCATSAHNKCLYCVVAHGALLRVYFKKFLTQKPGTDQQVPYNIIADQVSNDFHKSYLIDKKQTKMLDYALLLCKEPHLVKTQHLVELKEEYKFSRDAIWDIGAITSFFAASNRLAHMSGLMPNEEFYEIGRKPLPPKKQ